MATKDQGSVFSATLHEITRTKLSSLAALRTGFEQGRSDLLLSLQQQTDALARLEALAAGAKKCLNIPTDQDGHVKIGSNAKTKALETELKNLDRFLAQAKWDPSVSTSVLERWEKRLVERLETQAKKYEYAELYGALVTEWLSYSGGDDGKQAGAAEAKDAFETVDSAKKLKARMEFESTAFEPADVNIPALEAYLSQTFQEDTEPKSTTARALEKLRNEVANFGRQLASSPEQFTTTTFNWVVDGLLKSDLLSNKRRSALRDFKGNPMIATEICDVLNMRLTQLSDWSWDLKSPGAGIPVTQQRKVSGIYDVRMVDEDLLQAMLLQFIGVKWSVFFRSALRDYCRAKGTWKSNESEVPAWEEERLKEFLQPKHLAKAESLEDLRWKEYRNRYYLAKLLSSNTQQVELADGEEEAEYDSRKREVPQTRAAGLFGAAAYAPAPMMMRKMMVQEKAEEEEEDDDDEDMGFGLFNGDGDRWEEGEEKPKKPMEAKQHLLHLLSTEIILNTRLNGGISVFHSIFKGWGAMLPHQTVNAIFKFLGVPSEWLGFFKRFLEMPLKVVGDEEDAAPRARRRGMPASHVLSDVMGEVALFCLDLSVNRQAEGNLLWRMGEDFWFWSPNEEIVVQAWKAVNEFASATGTTIDTGKSGSVRVKGKAAADATPAASSSLPEGDIRWGLLRLSEETGRFEIDQEMVDDHIKELGAQLDEKKGSVIALILAWNTYVTTFLTSNFGRPSNCFGEAHVEDMLKTHQRVEEGVFSRLKEPEHADQASAPSIVTYLRNTIRTRFGTADVPEGFFYFPTEFGGLGLQSPFIPLLQIHDSVRDIGSPDGSFEKIQDAVKRGYQNAVAGMRRRRIAEAQSKKDWRSKALTEEEVAEIEKEAANFISLDEFVKHREAFKMPVPSPTIEEFWNKLLQKPEQTSVDGEDTEMMHHIDGLRDHPRCSDTYSIYHWSSMDGYWRWVTMMYGEEVARQFGGLSIVDAGLLPTGMVGLLRDGRMSWSG